MLAVEHDREVLVEVVRVACLRLPEARVLRSPTHRLRLRDLVEPLACRAR